jgi:hypothetical protein
MNAFAKLFNEDWMNESTFIKLISFIRAYLMTISTIWLIRFDWSSDKKWYAVMKCKTTSKWWKIVFQKKSTNFESRFDMMTFDSSQSSRWSAFNHTVAQSDALHVFLSSTRLTLLMNLSVVVSRAFCSLETWDKITTKSIIIVWNESVIVLIEFSSSYDEWRLIWLFRQILQWWMYLRNLLIMWRIYADSATLAYALWNSQWWLSSCVILYKFFFIDHERHNFSLLFSDS